MLRREKVMIGAFAAGLLGVLGLFGSLVWVLWRESVASEDAYAGNLAAALGQRTEQTITEIRDMLADFDKLPVQRCSKEHLEALQTAAVSRPYIRGIGFWRMTERLCGVGFLPLSGLKPQRADRIYESGVIAWWPSAQTEVGGVQLFLMRLGNHDVAIDPRMLLDLGTTQSRQAALWVEKLRMATVPPDAQLPWPDSLPVGVAIKGDQGQIVSHYSRNAILPIDIVAREPIANFWERHWTTLMSGAVLGLVLVMAWVALILRFSRYQLRPATELRQALAAHRITVQYQPVIDLRSGLCTGAEALARWQREDGSWTSPSVFVPIAEEAGLIHDLTLTVIRTVVHDLVRICHEVGVISVNINLSPEDLKNHRISEILDESLKASGLPAEAIKLEITERALVNSDFARGLIRQFRDRGHQVAIDDFGTGYSSLSYLQSFELDVLKIDKSFVDAIGTGAATSQVIVHVIEMAKSLGLQTVAEGVETEDQLCWLTEHGVLHAQGNFYSKPLVLAQFIDFLRKRRQPLERFPAPVEL
jgi:sensor c-di-GMP phosphodiesterase-like protein